MLEVLCEQKFPYNDQFLLYGCNVLTKVGSLLYRLLCINMVSRIRGNKFCLVLNGFLLLWESKTECFGHSLAFVMVAL